MDWVAAIETIANAIGAEVVLIRVATSSEVWKSIRLPPLKEELQQKISEVFNLNIIGGENKHPEFYWDIKIFRNNKHAITDS